jgi:hypothetical protein
MRIHKIDYCFIAFLPYEGYFESATSNEGKEQARNNFICHYGERYINPLFIELEVPDSGAESDYIEKIDTYILNK